MFNSGQAQSDDYPALQRLVSESFAIPIKDVPGWWDVLGRDNLRVVRDGTDLVATLGDIPMGWFSMGRRLPLHGVAAVAVCPTRRGGGVGRFLMTDYLADLRRQDVPLSALYASIPSLYKGVGYGVGGYTYRSKVRTAGWRSVGDRTGDWRRADDTDRDGIMALYHALGRSRGSGFDRGPYLWRRVWAHRGSPNQVWVLHDDGVAGWVVLRQNEADGWLRLEVMDCGARDAGSWARVLGFLSNHAPMCPHAEFYGGQADPLIALLPERAEVRLFEPWYLRVVHVERALADRGYSPDLTTTVRFRVVDPTVPENEGAYQVAVANGRAQVTRVEDAPLVVDVQGLAALFSHAHGVQHLVDCGLVHGPAPSLALLARVFAGSPPSLRDFF